MTKPTQRGRDPKDGRRKLKKDYWAVTITSGEFSMYAWERMDRRGVVHVKFIDPTRTGADRRQKRKLPGDFIVRDDRGRLDDEKVEDVKAIVAQAVARLVLGQEPFAESEPSEAASAVITLRSAFRNALDLQDGKYADKTRRVDEVSRAVRRLERVIGPNTPIVDAVAAPTVKRVWRVLARHYQKSSAPKGRKCGARQTEVTIDALYTVADWLIDEGRLPPGFFKRIRFWRLKLKDDWKQITGEEAETADEDKPRHSEEEMRQLFAVLDDPRRRLFRALRRRLPEGALAGATWSGLTFDDLGMPASLSVNWLRRIRTPRVKKEEWESRPASQRLVLDSRERALVADALRGYLHLLEEARQNGIVSDYPLFPEGDITDGAVAASATKALSLQGASPLTLDERFELAFEIGGEQRMGQVIKSTRRKLTLPGVDRWPRNARRALESLCLPRRERRRHIRSRSPRGNTIGCSTSSSMATFANTRLRSAQVESRTIRSSSRSACPGDWRHGVMLRNRSRGTRP